jgi:lyso-ornithine lipid O-acyltransferase
MAAGPTVPPVRMAVITLRIIAVLGVTAALLPLHLAALGFDHGLKARIPVWWHRAICAISGIRVVTRGEASPGRPLLVVANHVSWADIPVLGAARPLSFIAKSEVRDWPVFGWLARLQRTVFIDRNRKRDSARQAALIAERLVHKRDVMVLFAEGTTGDGTRLLPFKSALTGAAELARGADGTAVIQPVALAYVRRGGLPLGISRRIEMAWIGDVGLLGHMAQVLGGPPIDVEVLFGDPISVSGPLDRRAVTDACAATIGAMLADAFRGRPPRVNTNADIDV